MGISYPCRGYFCPRKHRNLGSLNSRLRILFSHQSECLRRIHCAPKASASCRSAHSPLST
jgi:hypothetical protein